MVVVVGFVVVGFAVVVVVVIVVVVVVVVTFSVVVTDSTVSAVVVIVDCCSLVFAWHPVKLKSRITTVNSAIAFFFFLSSNFSVRFLWVHHSFLQLGAEHFLTLVSDMQCYLLNSPFLKILFGMSTVSHR